LWSQARKINKVAAKEKHIHQSRKKGVICPPTCSVITELEHLEYIPSDEAACR